MRRFQATAKSSNKCELVKSGNLDIELSSIKYRRLRVPTEHGQSLQLPPLNSVEELWRANLNHIEQSAQTQIGDFDLKSLQESGRRELVELARKYTGGYLDVDLSSRSTEQVVMSGHQPELFHPGVWFKNFALSAVAQQCNCLAINLVVDNDVCGSTAIRYPSIDRSESKHDRGGSVSVGTIPVVASGPNIPFENRKIEDLDYFLSFPDRASLAISPLVENPIANLIWKQIQNRKKSIGPASLLGETIAIGRHRLENNAGLRTLEVPVSQISTTEAFAVFVKSILVEIERFHSAYNVALAEYRAVHKIRSSAHPVPELITENGWMESPFWIWHRNSPHRKRLFVKVSRKNIGLTDREGWETRIELANFVPQFRGLGDQVAIRPRALVTTMFCRLVLSDLFIHGIGGAKYDQLTDQIANRFFDCQPPSMMTISATLKIENEFQLPGRDDLLALRQLRREVEFHPETKIESATPEVQAIIDRKAEWISGKNSGQRAKARHLAINLANQQLQPFTTPSFAEISSKIAAIAGDLRKSAVLNSREYSFALFPESLMEELMAMAK